MEWMIINIQELFLLQMVQIRTVYLKIIQSSFHFCLGYEDLDYVQLPFEQILYGLLKITSSITFWPNLVWFIKKH